MDLITENPLTIDYLSGLTVSFLLWCTYVEVNPKIGGIFNRPDHHGKITFSLEGVIPLLKYPFQSIHFWKPEYFDMNWLIFSNVGAGFWILMQNSESIRQWLFN